MCELSRTAGKEFVSAATRMLNDLKITIRSMRELSDQRRGQIIISSIMSVANGKLPGLVSAHRLDYPGIELHVRDGVHGTIIEDVRSGAADFGISYLDSQPEPFTAVSLGKDDFTVVLSRNDKLARKKGLRCPISRARRERGALSTALRLPSGRL
jgi:DNA-binding transcriptional LysR family regulator